MLPGASSLAAETHRVFSLRLLTSRGLGRALLRVSVVTIATLLLLFVVIAALVQTDMRRQLASDHAVRSAEMDRALILRLQVDEETGLRGFVITNDRVFLQPFQQARTMLPAALNRLDRRLSDVEPALVPLARDLRSINAAWMSRVALPTIATSSPERRSALEISGKALVDRFRSISDAIAVRMTAFADVQDAKANSTITHLLDGSVAFGILLAIALICYAGVQARLARALVAQGDDYERLRRFAATLQEAFLAEPLPQVPSIEFDAIYAPALEEARVGGDWYGAFLLPDGRVYISMGDVAGHGVAASVTMARIRQTILSIAMHEPDPAIVLARANEVLRLRIDTMVTAFCAFIDPATFEITYASAGHPAPLVVSAAGDSMPLPVSGAPLGVAPDPGARTYASRLRPESMLVCYTDGLVEYDRDILRGEQRLRAVCAGVMRDAPERPAATILRKTIGAAMQRDDIAVLTVAFRSNKRRASEMAEKMGA